LKVFNGALFVLQADKNCKYRHPQDQAGKLTKTLRVI